MPAASQKFYYKSNRLQQLRGFCFAAQFGNISRAAAHLGLSQSSVSLQIKALEEELDCQIFTRIGPRIALTPAGEKLLQMALPLVDGIQDLYDEFHAATKARILSELHVAVNASAKNFLLPPVLREYLGNNADSRVVLHYVEHAEAMDLLKSGTVDIAVLARHDHLPFPKQCEYIPVFYCKSCLITLPDHPLAHRENLSVSEINRYPLVLPSKEMQIIPNLRETFEPTMQHQAQVDFINSDTVREYIEEGLVITIAPDVWVRKQDTLVATPLTHLFPDTDYGMVRMRSKPMPRKVRDLLDVMRAHAIKRPKERKSA